MIGGGFYALIGKVIGEAGMATPLALLLSGGLALLSGVSFAELAARYPSSAGPARYAEVAFGRPGFAMTIGWLVILTGVVSAATLAVATAGFFTDAFGFPLAPGILLLVLAMGLVAARGIGESVAVVTAITLVEIAALVYVLGLNLDAFALFPERAREVAGFDLGAGAWWGVFAGAFLAFYAFIGFEDMVTMAEEVRDVRRTLPRAILISILVTTTLYVLVSLVAVLAFPLERLIGARTPVAELGRAGGSFAAGALRVVSILTGINGALVQILMASRVMYGLAGRGQAPQILGRVNPRTRTPLVATALATAAILILALIFPLASLARATSTIMLLIFATVNYALFRVKRREGAGAFALFWPLLGFAATAAVIGFRLIHLARGL